MTTQSHGTIIYYDSNGSGILREVTAADVERFEQQIAELHHDLSYYMYGAYRDAVKIERLERLAQIAAAIMRSQPVGAPSRLVQAWNEAQAKEAG